MAPTPRCTDEVGVRLLGLSFEFVTYKRSMKRFLESEWARGRAGVTEILPRLSRHLTRMK